jgi:glycosyltransferase involved in cell wall biosynthesis
MYVLVPSYEPDTRLTTLVAELRAADPRTRILVVDDGSGERFASVFDRAESAGATVVRHERNRGKGAALRTGFSWIRDHAHGEVIVTADADGQHTVRDILAVAEETEPGGMSLVLGCRAFDGEVPLRSRAGNGFARRLFRLAAGWSLSDTQTGLRGVPPAMIDWLLEVPGDRFEYEQRVLLGLSRAGFDAVEVRIETVYLERNESSHFRPVLDSIRVMAPMLAFAASSLAGFLIDAVALFVLQALTGALIPSIIGARVISASANFALNRRIVFMRRGREHLARQIVSYGVLAAILLASNIAWMSFLTGIGLPLWLAKVITELALFALSFRAQKNAVFSSHTAPGVRAHAAAADSSPRFTESHTAS